MVCSTATAAALAATKIPSLVRGKDRPRRNRGKAWCQIAEALINRKGESALLKSLIEWETNHNYAHASKEVVRKEALQLHVARLFDNPLWVHFVPFNRQYRPEVLETAHLVTVVNECCNTPGEVTQEQVDQSAMV